MEGDSSAKLHQKNYFQGETSSDSVLAAIHGRKQKKDTGMSSGVQLRDKNVVCTQRIRDYVVKSGGKVFSDVICRKFKKECKEDWVQFRAILTKLCHYDRLKMEWHLKDEYW
ncbi:hypothetical protein TELCIR_07961 [Teladorsagia circumcincta]|uniref:Rad26/CSB-like winged helix DNA-binding domain-containing protein n=1 Tax=Teladorsagia circumcincta TaxID=45464 RepID=A0A2G9UJ68_TELCI|nr:hypothetical protein TELCIR_07961 [Teladorsagia circumcincta]